MAIIEVSHVTKRYRRHSYRPASTTLKSYFVREFWQRKPVDLSATTTLALDDVSFTVANGETLGVIGRNGSGKSTLLKLLTRIIQPDMGTVTLQGQVSSLIELGAGFHPELTGRENAIINGVILGFSKKEIKARLPEIIEFAELEEFIDDPVRTYSSGMYMRLAFAVAININPDVLLLDEILAVGDAQFTNKCLARMRSFREAGKTLVLVSHDAQLVLDWCDNVLWLHEGRIRELGPAAEVVSSYGRAMALT